MAWVEDCAESTSPVPREIPLPTVEGSRIQATANLIYPDHCRLGELDAAV